MKNGIILAAIVAILGFAGCQSQTAPEVNATEVNETNVTEVNASEANTTEVNASK